MDDVSRGAGPQSLTVTRSDVGKFHLEEIGYLIFSFLRSGVSAKRGVEFRHSTHNVSRTLQREMENRVS